MLVLAGCGGGAPRPEPGPPRLVTETVGRGVQQSTILRPGGRRRFPVVVFLHGWGAPETAFYRPWLEHLARRGSAVIYPRYQDSFVQPPRQALGNVLAALRIALARPGLDLDGLVIAGHSAGGALAADYAALAPTAGLPAPEAIFAAYPGRRLPRVPSGLPEVPPRLIGAGTRILALASRTDRVVGTATAQAMVRTEEIACRPGDNRCYPFPDPVGYAWASCRIMEILGAPVSPLPERSSEAEQAREGRADIAVGDKGAARRHELETHRWVIRRGTERAHSRLALPGLGSTGLRELLLDLLEFLLGALGPFVLGGVGVRSATHGGRERGATERHQRRAARDGVGGGTGKRIEAVHTHGSLLG